MTAHHSDTCRSPGSGDRICVLDRAGHTSLLATQEDRSRTRSPGHTRHRCDRGRRRRRRDPTCLEDRTPSRTSLRTLRNTDTPPASHTPRAHSAAWQIIRMQSLTQARIIDGVKDVRTLDTEILNSHPASCVLAIPFLFRFCLEKHLL